MPRIGEILSQTVPLSGHDIEEILQEQKATRLRFGEAAMALGKARPEQVWNAWLTQICHSGVDLTRWASDPAAVAVLPDDLATAYGLVPLRVRGATLVVAAAADVPDLARRQVERRCGTTLVVARADADMVGRSLAGLYPAAVPVA